MSYSPFSSQYSTTVGGTVQPKRSAFGSVPTQTAMPNPSADLAKVFPNLQDQNNQISANVGNELKGQLSPGTISAIRDNAANFGVSSGMPGSDFSGYRGLRNLGLQTEGVQQQGLKDYLSAITGIKNTQTVSPETQIALNETNAQLAAAPDPMAAAQEQERLFDKYLASLSGPAGGTGGYGGLPSYGKRNSIVNNVDVSSQNNWGGPVGGWSFGT